MDGFNSFSAPGGEIQPQHMNTLYPQQQQHQQQGFAPGSQQRDQLFQQTTKPAIQSQAGGSLMAPFPSHQPGAGGGPGAGGMGPGGMPTGMGGGPGMNPGGMGPGMGPSGMSGGMNVGPGMNIGGPGNMNAGPGMNVGGPGGMPGGMNGPAPGGMGGGPGGMGMNAPGMGMPGGPRPGGPGGVMVRKPTGPMGAGMGAGMGGMRPGMQQRIIGQNGMNPGLAGQNMGMPGLGGQGAMPNLGGNQGAMGGIGGPGGGLGGPGAGNMGNMMPSMGGAAGGMSVGSQPGGMGAPGNMGPGAGGPGGMGGVGMGGMGSMGLNSMGGSGAPGMSGGNMGGVPGNRQWYPEGMKRTTPQIDDFAPGLASQQHPHGVGGQPGGLSQHAVGGPGQMPHGGPQIPPGQAPPTQPAASPVGGLPAHQQHGPGHMPGGPGHMQGNTPRMATPAHPGGPPMMTNAPAPSPHHGSPAHPQHHQQPHLVGSPAHQNQMSSPRHMTSSSPAPGQGPHRSNAPTPVPPRGASADPMGMRPEGMRPDEMRLDPAVMRMGEGIGGVVRGPDGSLRPANEMMVVRDGRQVRDGMMEGINRAPSADGLGRPVIPPNGVMRPGEIGRLGPDGTMVRGPYGQPAPYGSQGGSFNQSAPQYVLHQTPAQQHQNMQIQRGAGAGVPRAGSIDEMPTLTAQMNLPDDLGDVMGVPNGPGRPNRQSLPPQMPMMNGAPRPVPGPHMVAGPRRSMLIPPRPCALGLGVVRMLQMSHELTGMNGKMISDWQRFREEYFTRSGKISMTIFYNVEGRKYIVSPELIARFFLTFFESGVNKMSLGLNGAIETSEGSRNELESTVETIQGTWRYELDNGWVVEHNGPMKIALVAEPVPGDPQQFKHKIEDLTFTAPTSSYFFRSEKLEGNRIHHGGRETGPMTPRISPGLAARKPGEPGMAGGVGGVLDEQGNQEQEERLMYENVTLPPMPFQAYGFPSAVWRMLAMSACVHELQPIMQLDHASQSGPIVALDQYADMDQNARAQAGFEFMDDMGGHGFPNFTSGFNPSMMSSGSPALAHTHPGMHPTPGSTATIGRPTPTPPPVRPGPLGGHRSGMNQEQPLAGSGELPPLPKLAPGIPTGMPPGMVMTQSPSLSHQLPPGQQNGLGMKRKLGQPEHGPDVGGPSGAPSGSHMRNMHGGPTSPNTRIKPPPAATRKKAKTNTTG